VLTERFLPRMIKEEATLHDDEHQIGADVRRAKP
jgi:hypothetical protein